MKEGIGEFCETTEDCRTTNTVCTAHNTCECKSNYVAQNENECKPGLTAPCDTVEDCAFENAECKLELVDETKRCRCKDDFVGVGNVCLEKGESLRCCAIVTDWENFEISAKSYNDTCIENEQCKPLLGDKGSCNDHQCNCEESLQFKDGQCNDKKGLLTNNVIWSIFTKILLILDLNEQCTKTGECFVENDPETAECRNGICQCKFNYTPDNTQNRCARPRQKSKLHNVPSHDL